jgi:hypothetical protein
MKQPINEAKRMQQLAGILKEGQLNEEGDKKWESINSFYQTPIEEKTRNEIKKELGIGDDDIQFGYSADQADSMYWYSDVKININALPEDKKSTAKNIINKIVNDASKSKDDESKKEAPSDPEIPVVKKSGVMDKIKSLFKGKQQESLDIESVVNEALKAIRKK